MVDVRFETNQGRAQLVAALQLGALLGPAANHVLSVAVEKSPYLMVTYVQIRMKNGCFIRVAQVDQAIAEGRVTFTDDVITKIILLSDPTIKSKLKVDL